MTLVVASWLVGCGIAIETLPHGLDGVVLLDADRSIVAREGQLIHVGGGQDSAGTITICEIDGTAYP